MHAIILIQRLLVLVGAAIHKARLQALLSAVQSLFVGGRLTVTALGKSLPGPTLTKHSIKRIDRLAGNRHLHQELPLLFAALVTRLIGNSPRPLILIDWTPTAPGFYALVASVPVGGRALPIYLEVHPVSKHGNRRVQRKFLHRLAATLPIGCRPIIVADGGFHTPFYADVVQLGWDFVGRLGEKVAINPAGQVQWWSGSQLYLKASHRIVDLGVSLVTQKHPVEYRVILGRKPKPKPKRRRSRRGGRVSKPVPHTGTERNQRKRALDPWLLCTSLLLLEKEQVVGIYKRRMEIDEGFRDIKSHQWGWSFEDTKSQQAKRLQVLLLVAALGSYGVVMVGLAAEQQQLQYRYQANTTKTRRVLSLFHLGKLIVMRKEESLLIGVNVREVHLLLQALVGQVVPDG
jgi:Transposase DDE domain